MVKEREPQPQSFSRPPSFLLPRIFFGCPRIGRACYSRIPFVRFRLLSFNGVIITVPSPMLLSVSSRSRALPGKSRTFLTLHACKKPKTHFFPSAALNPRV